MKKSEITILSTPDGFTEQEVNSVGQIEIYLLAGFVVVVVAAALCLFLFKRKPATSAEPTSRISLYEK